MQNKRINKNTVIARTGCEHLNFTRVGLSEKSGKSSKQCKTQKYFYFFDAYKKCKSISSWFIRTLVFEFFTSTYYERESL